MEFAWILMNYDVGVSLGMKDTFGLPFSLGFSKPNSKVLLVWFWSFISAARFVQRTSGSSHRNPYRFVFLFAGEGSQLPTKPSDSIYTSNQGNHHLNTKRNMATGYRLSW